ncbi:hypothetical protein Q7P37_005523 [Cladosporium fusiforme]
MRISTVTSLLLSVLPVCAQTTTTGNSTPGNLLQSLEQLPGCAINCVSTTLTTSPCAFGDLACLCNDEAYIASSGACIQSKCTVKEALCKAPSTIGFKASADISRPASQKWQKETCQAPVRDNGNITRTGGIIMIALAAFCVMCRLIARWRIQNSSLGWDDWTILLSLALLVPSTAILHIMTDYGMGNDVWTVPFDDITTMFRYFYVEQYLYQAVIVCTKISIVLLYLRIFPKEVSSRFRQLCWAVIIGLVLYLIAFYIYYGLECKPISYFWLQWDGKHEGHCNNLQAAIYVNSAFNILFDLIVFCLPVPKLLKLQVQDTRRKVVAVLTFMVGLFVTVCTLIRLQYLSQFSKQTNPTYHYQDIAIWSGAEADIGVICACMPTILGPLMYFFRETVGSKLSKSNSKMTLESGPAGNNKSIQRLPSREGEDLEMNHRTSGHGGIEKTVRTSVYEARDSRASGDDVGLIIQGPKAEERKNNWEA